MQKFYKPFRMALIFIVMAALLTVYVTSLYKLQIYDVRPISEEHYPQSPIKTVETLAAARGDIYDRNGILLVSSRPSYNIKLSWEALKKTPDMNGIILELVYAAAKNGIRHSDSFPMTIGAPFDYLSGMKKDQRALLDRYLEYKKLDPAITAIELFNQMKQYYDIDYKAGIGIKDARLIIGVRYELETRMIQNMNNTPYTFAKDVGADFVALVKELGYPGIIIEPTSVREYHTDNAAHLLGIIGSIDSNDREKFYVELGYPLDAQVGKMGAELAFEEYLHGTPGRRTVLADEYGSVLNITDVTEPVPGCDIYLTIDIRLQAAVEAALKEYIDEINLSRDEDSLVHGGSVVVTDVNTGELLASASYPTFSLENYWSDYPTLVNDTVYRPLVNRATQGQYSPGSTYKMVTAFAGLRAGAIGRWSTYYDSGRFMKYAEKQFAPACWVLGIEGHGHGWQDVVGALENSCNYFFYQLGDSLGGTAAENADTIAAAASDFGLGQKTGLHITENSGRIATPEYKMSSKNEGWWAADTILASIGQSLNLFTPVQLANYTATIANSGTLYSLTELSKVKSHDFSTLIYEHTPTVVNQFSDGDAGYIKILQEGMRAAAKTGTAQELFSSYSVPVAAKTGTVQSDASKTDNGVFVCYAPYNNPEIAISVVIERGKSGREIMGVARTVLDFYFEGEQSVTVAPEGELIR